jgi:thioredoxin 1
MREQSVLVVCLCAAWCHVCGEFRDTFERLAGANPHARFIWLDIEDEAALLGDLEIESFPALAVFRDAVPLFYGATPPQEPVVARTLAALFRKDLGPSEVPQEILALPGVLGSRLERRDRG